MEAKQSEYQKIESVWETHLKHKPSTPKDIRDITEAVDKYGEDKVLESMREAYAQGAKITSFNYIFSILESKEAEKSKSRSRIKNKAKNLMPSEDAFISNAKKQDMINKNRLRQRAQHKKLNTSGYLIPGFPKVHFTQWWNNGKCLDEDPMPDELKEIQENFMKGVRA